MPLFAARYPGKIAGMVLVDPVVPVEWNPPSEHDLKRARIGSQVCRRAALLSRAGVIRFVAVLLNSRAKNLASHMVRLISRGTPPDSGSVSSPWFWNLPPNERQMASVFWVQEKFCNTIASQLENLPESARRIAELDNLCDEPVVILSAKSTPPRRLEQHILISQRAPLASCTVPATLADPSAGGVCGTEFCGSDLAKGASGREPLLVPRSGDRCWATAFAGTTHNRSNALASTTSKRGYGAFFKARFQGREEATVRGHVTPMSFKRREAAGQVKPFGLGWTASQRATSRAYAAANGMPVQYNTHGA